MKLFKKEKIDVNTRKLTILGMTIIYLKDRIPETNKIKYTVKIAGLSFNIYKIKNMKPKKGNTYLKIDKMKKLYALIFARSMRNFYSKNNAIETMVLGTSCARCSFIEDEKSINFGLDAQDLYYTYQMFKKYKDFAPKLKNIVIYYEVFSNGNDLDISSSHLFVPAFYKFYLDLPYKNKLNCIKNNLMVLENKLASLNSYINKKITSLPEDIMPIDIGEILTEKEMANWAKAEIKLGSKNNMNIYLNALLNEASNYNVYIVLSPRNPVVKNVYPETKELFKDLFELVGRYNNVKIIDIFNKFESEDFADLLHLNLNGAKKITNIIKKAIEDN